MTQKKNISIEFKNVCKVFETWHDRPHSIKTLLTQIVKFQLKLGKREKLSVLENINFKIYQGDFVGIMGKNGVGKSTILKLISKIYNVNSGEIITNGRIAPLLELGAGFSSELTGEENIFLNGSILGFGRKEINQKLEAIKTFSDLGEALTKPVRNYSSGMLVKLGFAIAAHLDAQILLFDEILAVGDVGFQKKCLQKINELHKSGKTIVLVTHSPEQVEQHCNRCLLIDKTGVSYDGSALEGAKRYKELF